MTPAKPLASHRASRDLLKGAAQPPQQLARAPGLKGGAGEEPRPQVEDNKPGPRAGAARPRGGGHRAVEGVRLSQGPPERSERVGTWADPWGLEAAQKSRLETGLSGSFKLQPRRSFRHVTACGCHQSLQGRAREQNAREFRALKPPGRGRRLALAALGFLPVCSQGWRLRKVKTLRGDARASQCPV